MTDLLREVKTTKRVQNNIEKFEALTLGDITARSASDSQPQIRPVVEIDNEQASVPLLSAVSSKSTATTTSSTRQSIQTSLESLTEVSAHKRTLSAVFLSQDYLKDGATATLCDDAREVLKSQPDVEDIRAVLTYLHYGIEGYHDFNVKKTGPKASQIVRVLATLTIPDLWSTLQVDSVHSASRQTRKFLLEALFSVAGIEAILEQIRILTRPGAMPERSLLHIYLDFLDQLLSGTNTVSQFIRDAKSLYDKDVQQKLFWQAVTSLLAGSKILSTTASVPNIVAETDTDLVVPDWLIQGSQYSQWLAQNIVKASIDVGPNDSRLWLDLSQLLRRGLSLGYKDAFVSRLYRSFVFGKSALWTPLHQLLVNSSAHDTRTIFECILNDLASHHLYGFTHVASLESNSEIFRCISGAAALISGLIGHNEQLLDYAVDWVCDSRGKNIGIKRALMAVLARNNSNIERVLERSMVSFSDKLQIQHISTAQQQYLTQTIILAIGCLHRQSPMALRQDPFPSLTMQSVSNRLASSLPQIRLLGMVVGVAMSRCVDEPGKVMDFDSEEMESAEAQCLLSLLDTQDTVGVIEDLNISTVPDLSRKQLPQKRKISSSRATLQKGAQQKSKIMSIEEVASSSDEEDDLVPYNKPVDDAEDSDDDPTLINRDKPKPPIYIVDLIKQLQSSSDRLDVINLALNAAQGLIKRKANFGTELSDNIHALASALVNLQDGMSKPENEQQRLDAVVACVAAKAEQMGPYLADTYFQGDFSLSQRSTILIAIGLGARELAGFSDSNAKAIAELDLFPSNRLPSHLQPNPIKGQTSDQQILQHISNPITSLSRLATMETIRPLAEAAVSSQTGPDILKVAKTNRTSSSMSLKSKQADSLSRTKRIPKNISALLANKIYLPLCSPLTAILSYTVTPSRSHTQTSLLQPNILALHIQTLTLLLHTLGPTGLSAPSIYTPLTSETLLLLTALQRNPRLCLNPVVLPAHLALFLALIDITVEIGVTAQERLLGRDFGEQAAELVRWTAQLERMQGVPPPVGEKDGGAGGVAWTVLAAGIQVRWYEIGRRFQSRMLGFNIDE